MPLVICDRTFNEDGSFYYPSLDPTLMEEPGVLASSTNGMYSGVFGDTILDSYSTPNLGDHYVTC